MSKPVRLAIEGSDGTLRVSPPLFIENRTGVDPADLSQLAPHGNGVYGYQQGLVDPFKTAPTHDDIGGFVFFRNNVSRIDFDTFIDILGIRSRSLDYAVFYQESENPGEDGYLSQMRVVSRFALRHMFGSITDAQYSAFENQELSKAEALWGFMENERKKYGIHFGDSRLSGKFGGDGDFAQEKLCFGLMVENSYYHVYRIWSRASLVTK